MTADAESHLRRIYVGPWRVDFTVHRHVPQLLPASALARVAGRALSSAGAPSPASIGLILSDDVDLAGLNREHMGQHGPTDVLSFPLLQPDVYPAHPGKSVDASPAPLAPRFVLPPSARVHLGDIVISVERAIAQARRGQGGQTGTVAWAPADELRLLVTHGVLHVCGWDHADPVEELAMRALELALLRS